MPITTFLPVEMIFGWIRNWHKVISKNHLVLFLPADEKHRSREERWYLKWLCSQLIAAEIHFFMKEIWASISLWRLRANFLYYFSILLHIADIHYKHLMWLTLSAPSIVPSYHRYSKIFVKQKTNDWMDCHSMLLLPGDEDTRRKLWT